MWLPEDTDYALAWQAEEAAACDGCGFPRDESMDPEKARGGSYRVRRLVCFACQERQAAMRESSDAKGSQAGLYIAVEEV